VKVAILGSKNAKDKDIVEAIQASTYKVTELLVATKTGIDEVVQRYADKNKLPIEYFGINWDDLEVEGAVIAVNSWGKQYNKAAPAMRTQQIVESSDAVIIIDDGEVEARFCTKKAQELGINFYTHSLINKTEGSYAQASSSLVNQTF